MALDQRSIVGWRVYPFPPEFWNRKDVLELDPQLDYFGPLPQTNAFVKQIVELNMHPVSVYVIQDVEGDVLYVGKTLNPVGRLAAHRAKKDWWPERGQLTILGLEADNRADADRRAFWLEKLAIRVLHPRHNIAGVVR